MTTAIGGNGRIGILGSDRTQAVGAALIHACEAFTRMNGAPVPALTRRMLISRLNAYAATGEQDPAKWVDFALGGFRDLLGTGGRG
jgi:hypothetical protein